MIYTSCKVTVKNYEAKIDRTIVLYKGDKNIEVQFELLENVYKQYKLDNGNIITNLGASYGQLIVQKPDHTYYFSEVAPTNDGIIIFVIPERLIDEDSEIGLYTFQIRLFDETQDSRVTLPPVIDGISVVEPIAVEATDTE